MSFCATAENALTLGLGTTIAYRLASAGLAAESAALALLCAAACGLSASALYLVLHRIQASAALLEGRRAML